MDTCNFVRLWFNLLWALKLLESVERRINQVVHTERSGNVINIYLASNSAGQIWCHGAILSSRERTFASNKRDEMLISCLTSAFERGLARWSGTRLMPATYLNCKYLHLLTVLDCFLLQISGAAEYQRSLVCNPVARTGWSYIQLFVST